jgi:hypothetical protein
VKGDVSVKVAARFFRVSEVTITRKCKAGIFPNAFQLGEKSTWNIPAADILGVCRHREDAEMRLSQLAKVFEV